ncbi:MAG: phenylacetate--CoA ligase [Candidatus Omnitrophica bacterium]|jgi:phenylacetate-CoA ligase|nr:phenylacetate--CoA ligase [Candidatus Omnitrophota bacterium]MDD5080147.1 phenylacetate--CoA ligase [Candidatus Omnitrophota bacterium]
MIWNEKMECINPKDLKNLQYERLRNVVSYVYRNCPMYREKLDKYGVAPKDIKTLSDIKKLPFATKEDMRDSYPFGLFSVPGKDIAELHVSSGTTGNPTVVGYTKEDLDLWAEVIARALGCAGAEPGDKIQIAYGYGLFTGGLGFHYGALKMGLTIIPTSSGQTRRQLKIMNDFRPRILACTPSYALYMVDEAREMGLPPRNSSWEIGIFGAEPWSEPMRKEIENTWNMLATDVYGLSEIIGPGVAQECTHKNGLHVFWDVFFPEVIDPKTGVEVKDGGKGELVITTLTKKGLPLLRYRTRDIVSIKYEKCACGRTTPRISKILGRTDDMIIVRGINVFPSQIEHVLLNIEGTQPHYQLVVERKSGGLDELEVLVEVEEKIFSDEIKKLRGLEEKIRESIENNLGVSVKVKLVEPKTIARSEGKAKRVIDKRIL